MDYKKITDTTSSQYKLINTDQIKIRNDGLLSDANEFIGVALGSKYGEIGDKFVIELDTGKTVKVIKIDEKSDNDTINKCHHPDGSMVELVIDTDLAKQSYYNAIRDGDFNSADFFNGKVVGILKIIE